MLTLSTKVFINIDWSSRNGHFIFPILICDEFSDTLQYKPLVSKIFTKSLRPEEADFFHLDGSVGGHADRGSNWTHLSVAFRNCVKVSKDASFPW
jgi:hypothetical protein